MKFEEDAKKLKVTHWPACDSAAMSLAAKGTDAIEALIAASSSRIHHVRSASLRALATVDKDRARELADKLKNDRAYEVRETAALVLSQVAKS